MQVLIVSQYFWPETFRITEVARALYDEGCNISVLTGQPNYPDGTIYHDYSACSIVSQCYHGIGIYRVPLIPRGKGGGFSLIANYVSFIVTASIFGPWLFRKKNFDVIFVFAPSPILQAIPAMVLAKLKNARLVTWIQDLWPESLSATGFVKSNILLALVSQVVRWIYRHNDLLLVQSEAFLAPVRQMAGKTPVTFHPNPGDLEYLDSPSNDCSKISFGQNFNVVFTGNLGKAQALETIIEAATLLKEEQQISFVLVGSGSRSEWLSQMVVKRSLNNVRLPGRFPLSDMPFIMEQASVLLVSLNRSPIMSLTIPSKIQAYLAAGKPIIASLDGEGARVVQLAGAGLTCPAENAKSLAEAVKKLRAMSVEQREQMGKNGRKYYLENFEPKMLAKKLLRIFADIWQKKS